MLPNIALLCIIESIQVEVRPLIPITFLLIYCTYCCLTGLIHLLDGLQGAILFRYKFVLQVFFVLHVVVHLFGLIALLRENVLGQFSVAFRELFRFAIRSFWRIFDLL